MDFTGTGILTVGGNKLIPFRPPTRLPTHSINRLQRANMDDAIATLTKFEAGLKISSHKENIWAKLEEFRFLFLSMPTGSGKSLGIPSQMIINGKYKSIWISEPTVPATRGIHKTLLEHSCQDLVGWGATGKFEYKASTPIKVMTTGHMVNKCIRVIKGQERPPEIIMMDEIHTPTTENYMVFMLICHIVKEHPELLVVVTSATLNCSDLLQHAPDSATIYSNEEERRWPLEIKYDTYCQDGIRPYHATLDELQTILGVVLSTTPSGSGIIFFGGEGEIEDKSPNLEELVSQFDPDMIVEWVTSSLFDVSTAWPDDGIRRLYLCTNVAESSVTLNDISFVIDTGYHKTMIQSGDTSVLQVQPISRANADQRAGRTGRTRPGTVYRMYSKEYYEESMKPYIDYEFNILPPYGPLLKMYSCGLDPNILKIDFVRLGTLTKKLQSLKLLTDDNKVTELGKEVVKYPISIPNATLLAAMTMCIPMTTGSTLAGMCMFIAAVENGAPSKLLFTPKSMRKSLFDRIAHYDEYHKSWCRDDDLEALVYLVFEYISLKTNKQKRHFCRDNSLHNRTFAGIGATYRSIAKQIPTMSLVNYIDTSLMDFDLMRELVTKTFPDRIMEKSILNPSLYIHSDCTSWIFRDASCLTSEPIPSKMCFMSLFVCEGKKLGKWTRLASCGVRIVEPECDECPPDELDLVL